MHGVVVDDEKHNRGESRGNTTTRGKVGSENKGASS